MSQIPAPALATISRSRRLPIPGEVLVQLGQSVQADTLVARTEIPGVPIPVRVAARLSIEPQYIHRYMLKQEGEAVDAGEPLALLTSFFGRSKEYVTAPRAGTVESVSPQSGIVVIREPSIPVSTVAYLAGIVAEIIPQEGAVIEAVAKVVFGTFGIGGERYGRLQVVSPNPEATLLPEHITKEAAGAVILAGADVSADALRKAASLNVVGIIAGSIDNTALREYLGYEIGVPITGQEDTVTTLILTSGFGRLPMDAGLWRVLSGHAGEIVSINGTTHLRSNLVKPEIIISVAQPGAED